MYAGRGRIKIKVGSGLVSTKGVSAPSVVPNISLYDTTPWLIAGSPRLRLWLNSRYFAMWNFCFIFFKDQPNDFHNKTMAGVREYISIFSGLD